MSNPNKHMQQTIALAAVFQSAALVEQLARTGDIPQTELESLISSLFKQNPDSFDEIYGAEPLLQAGFNGICQLTSGAGSATKRVQPDVMRYALSIMHLESRLSGNKHMMSQLGDGITNASRQAEHFHITHENLLANLADLYKQTLSTLSFRIKVTGNPQILQNQRNANKVRVLLLTGIRAAILWRQVGGRRWHLLFSRKRYHKDARALLVKN